MKTFDVIILCGGKGKRLRPLTQNTPKPLTKIKNKPFLYYLIHFFLKKDFKIVLDSVLSSFVISRSSIHLYESPEMFGIL